MGTFLVIITVVIWISFVLVSAVRPLPSLISMSELGRRAHRAGAGRAALRREEALPDIIALQRILAGFLFVGGVLMSISTFGWPAGSLVSFLAALLYGSVGSWRFVHGMAQGLYEKVEPRLVEWLHKAQPVFRIFRGTTLINVEDYRRIDSRDELIRLVEKAGDALSEQDGALISHGLEFPEVLVSKIMTPRSDIKSVKKSEFLGPLVLSELHDAGHSRLPVIAQDLDHVVGFLYVRDLLSLDVKRSMTAEKAMDKVVHYVHRNDTLEQALALFLEEKQHLMVVINDRRETVGLLALTDIIEALLGRRVGDL